MAPWELDPWLAQTKDRLPAWLSGFGGWTWGSLNESQSWYFYLINRTRQTVPFVNSSLSFIWTIFVQSSSEVPHVDAALPPLALSWPHVCGRGSRRGVRLLSERRAKTRCDWHVYTASLPHKTRPHGRSSAVTVITGCLFAEVPATRREARFSPRERERGGGERERDEERGRSELKKTQGRKKTQTVSFILD